MKAKRWSCHAIRTMRVECVCDACECITGRPSSRDKMRRKKSISVREEFCEQNLTQSGQLANLFLILILTASERFVGEQKITYNYEVTFNLVKYDAVFEHELN